MNRRIPNNLFSLLLLISFASCNNDVECNSLAGKTLIKNILVDNSDYNSWYLSEAGVYNQFELDVFYKKRSELINIRTSSINDDINKCECQATLKFNVNSSETKYLNDFPKKTIELLYTLQKTENGDLYAETYLPDGLNITVGNYFNAVRVNNEKFYNEEMQNLIKEVNFNPKELDYFKEFLIKEWKMKKNNKHYPGPIITQVYFEDNRLIIDGEDFILSSYNFHGLNVYKNKSSNTVIKIINEGAGEGGNVGIIESYLIWNENSGERKIELAHEEFI